MRYIAIFLIMLSLSACNSAQPNDAGSSSAQQKKAVAMIGFGRSDPLLSSFPQSCPASVYKTGSAIAGEVADYTKNPRKCITQCKSGNGKACFDVVQIVEAGNSPDDNLATYPLYMRACSLGDGNACVNAGAAIKNIVWSAGKPPEASTPLCQLQTFSTMCKAGHAWGCYMTAQEYKSGGFDWKSEAKYEQYMRSACKISKTSGSCYPAFR